VRRQSRIVVCGMSVRVQGLCHTRRSGPEAVDLMQPGGQPRRLTHKRLDNASRCPQPH